MKIHYAMPVRSMLFDALRYARQCKELEQEHREKADLNGSDEFLSGISKTDKVKPVITLVIYYGETKWDGPVSLHEMLDVQPKFLSFVNNQSIHLLQVKETDGMQFQNPDNIDFFTTLGQFYNNNKKFDVHKFRREHPDKNIHWETLAAIAAASGSDKLMEYAWSNKGGRINMCTALANWEEKVLQEGLQKGQEKGRQEGTIQGMILAYLDTGLSEEMTIQKIQAKLNLSAAKAADYVDLVKSRNSL